MLKYLVHGETFTGSEGLMQECFSQICWGRTETNRETFLTVGMITREIPNFKDNISNSLLNFLKIRLLAK